MSAKSFSLLAAVVFSVVSVLQLVRAVQGWPVTIDTMSVPVTASWVAFAVAGLLALLGFSASRR